MVGLCCWLVVYPLLDIDGSHMDDLCHPYHSWYTETGNSMYDLTENNTKPCSENWTCIYMLSHFLETACPLHSSKRSTFDIGKTKRNPVTPTDSTTCPMTDRVGGGHPWAVFWTTFDIINAFEDTHSREISRKHKHKLYVTVLEVIEFFYLTFSIASN